MKRVEHSNRGNATDRARAVLVETMIGKETAGRLPSKVLERFKGVFEGKYLPRSKSALPSGQYLEGLAGVCDKYPIKDSLRRLGRFLEIDAPQVMIDDEIDRIVQRIGMVLQAAGKSRRPSAYMGFLSNPKLKMGDFFESMAVMSQRQGISFESLEPSALEKGTRIVEAVDSHGISRECMEDFICERIAGIVEGIGGDTGALNSSDRLIPESICELVEQYGIYYYQKEKALLRFDKFYRHGRTKIHVLKDSPFFEEKGWSGLTLVKVYSDILLNSERRSTLQHELQHVFDYLIGLGGEKTGMEFRAKLAGIAFAETDEFTERGLIVGKILSSKIGDQEDSNGHLGASIKMRKTMLHGGKKDLPWQERALWYLNREYKRLCGLTYDQILEPFLRN